MLIRSKLKAPRQGLCSTWLSRLSPGHTVPLLIRQRRQFILVNNILLSVGQLLNYQCRGSESHGSDPNLHFDSYPEQNTEPNFGKFRLQLLEQIQSSNSCIFLTFRNLCIRIRLFGKWSIAQCCFYFCLLYMQTSAGFVMNQNISF